MVKTAVLTDAPARNDSQQQHLWIFAPAARPVRFIIAGFAAAAVQIVTLSLLVISHEEPEWANAIAVMCGIQASFALSSLFTWHDQPASSAGALTRRWLRFMTLLSGTALLNEGIFLIVYHWLPVIVASLLASSLIALLNYALGKRFIFSH